jgi:pantoate--beta-alanine ligase
LEADLDALSGAGVDLVFAPAVAEMYPQGCSTVVAVAGPAEGLESVARPHFFAGVATVVTKLLIQCAPDVALFGEKDFQQLAVIRRLVVDLSLPVEVLAGETVREADGLALSSRNAYFGPEDRARAPALHAALAAAARKIGEGGNIQAALAVASSEMVAAGFSIDYLELRDTATLAPLEALGHQQARLLVAARLGAVRLIDNAPVNPTRNGDGPLMGVETIR